MRHPALAALGTQPLLGLARASPYRALLCLQSCQSCLRASSATVLPAALQAGHCLLQAAQEGAGGAWVLTVRLQGISLSQSSAQFLRGGERAAGRRRIVSEPRFIHAQGRRVGGEPASLPGSCTCKMLRCFFHCLEVILTNGAFLSPRLLCVHTQDRRGGQVPCTGPVAPCPGWKPVASASSAVPLEQSLACDARERPAHLLASLPVGMGAHDTRTLDCIRSRFPPASWRDGCWVPPCSLLSARLPNSSPETGVSHRLELPVAPVAEQRGRWPGLTACGAQGGQGRAPFHASG